MTAPHDAGGSERAAAAESVFTKLFLTPEGRANPYPLYHQLRQTAPVYRTKLGMWVLSRYDDCWAAMRAPRLGKDYAPQIEQRFGADWRRHPSLTAGEHSMLNTSGPEHSRLRKLVTKEFTPRVIANLKPVIEQVVDQLLDPVAEAGGGNVLEAVGFPLPVTIIGAMLGVPFDDRPQFRGMVRDLVAIFEMQPTDEQMASADAAQLGIRAYFLDLIAEKRRQPGEDLLSKLATAEVGGERLTDASWSRSPRCSSPRVSRRPPTSSATACWPCCAIRSSSIWCAAIPRCSPTSPTSFCATARERGILLDTVRSATVTAMSHMITYAISRKRLRALVAGNAAATDWMLQQIRRRYSRVR
ncbi:MAG TPA: cytochrome P450 [Candidatus Margulisiibacteriota bacterium]|nr:cytochrome P450 [Candidatus Margulisiibacteriota bacterium]